MRRNEIVKRYDRFVMNKKFQFFLLYSIVSLIMIRVCFYYFEESRKGFGWAIDSLPVQFPMFVKLRYFVRELIENIRIYKEIKLPSYDFSLGMGGDVLTYLSMWYLEPIAFLGVFFNHDKMEWVYDTLTMLRIYIAGLSFGAYCFYMKQTKVFPVVCGSLIYVFSGWCFFFLRHPVFYATLIYLPLLFIGIEEILKKKNAFFFSFLIFLSAVTHYYFLYVNTIFVSVYFLIRYCDCVENKTFKKFVGFIYAMIWRYILGIGLASFTLLPNMVTFLNSNRRNKIIESGSLWHFEHNWGQKVILSMAAADYAPGYYLYNGFATTGIIFFLICFARKAGALKFKITMALLTIAFTFPLITFAFHVFSSVHFRWNYIIGFIFGIAAVRVLSQMEQIKFHDIFIAFAFVLLYSGIQAVYPKLSNANSVCGTFFLLAVTILVLFYVGLQKQYKQKFYLLFLDSILLLTCFNIYYNAKNVYSPDMGNYISEFVDKNNSYNQIVDTSISAISDQKDGFYRVDCANPAVKNENASVFLNHYGVSFYVNVMDKYLAEYNYGLENRGTRLLDTLDNDNRTIMEALASVRYFTIYEGEEADVPYGYSLIEEGRASDGRKCKIYENDYFLPLGYTYGECISESEYNKLNALEKQECLLQTAVVEAEEPLFSNMLKENVASTVERENDITIRGTGCEYDAEENKVKVLQSGGFLTIEFPGRQNCETYVRLDNLNINTYKDAYWTISLFNDAMKIYKYIEVRSDTATYSYGCYNHLINLGYSQEGISSINIGFPFEGEFILDEIQVYYQPMGNYGEQISVLKQDTLENIEETVNEVTGNIKLSEDKLLVLSIPYNKGWTAYVDGKKRDLKRVNVTYMGLLMEKGVHTIRLKYETYGLKQGCFISGATAVIAVFIFWGRRRRIKTSRNN